MSASNITRLSRVLLLEAFPDVVNFSEIQSQQLMSNLPASAASENFFKVLAVATDLNVVVYVQQTNEVT